MRFRIRSFGMTCVLLLIALSYGFLVGTSAKASVSASGCPSGQAGFPAPVLSASITDDPADNSRATLNTLVTNLVVWIGENSAYDVSNTLAEPPRILFATENAQVVYEGRILDLGPTLRATYDAYAREIHLKCPWDPTDPLDRSTLLHELVHDVQYGNRDWSCPRAAEWEAYGLQADWLEQQGQRPAGNWLQAVLSSGCLRDVHP